jgi:carboxyl-terminal processing protease
LPYSPVAAFRGKVGESAMLEIRRRPDAEPQRLAVPVVPIRPVVAFPAATAASARVIERNGLRIGYVHVWSLHESGGLKAALARLEPDKQSTRASRPGTARTDGRLPAEDGARPVPGRSIL